MLKLDLTNSSFIFILSKFPTPPTPPPTPSPYFDLPTYLILILPNVPSLGLLGRPVYSGPESNSKSTVRYKYNILQVLLHSLHRYKLQFYCLSTLLNFLGISKELIVFLVWSGRSEYNLGDW